MTSINNPYNACESCIDRLHEASSRLSSNTRSSLTANCERNEAKQTNLASALTTPGLGEND